MRKTIKVKLTGYGRETVELAFDEEPTLSQALAEAGWTLASGETASVNGETADLEDILESGDTVQVVGKKEGGK
jgi:sulfur carrier protein ThiS